MLRVIAWENREKLQNWNLGLAALDSPSGQTVVPTRDRTNDHKTANYWALPTWVAPFQNPIATAATETNVLGIVTANAPVGTPCANDHLK